MVPREREPYREDSRGSSDQDGKRDAHAQILAGSARIPEGLKAIRQLTDDGIATNCTLCFSLTQAWLAAKAGAGYISPFIGRLDDIGEPGMELVHDIREVYDRYGFATQVLAASLRHPQHVREALLAGADVGTLPFSVFKQLAAHPLTDKGLAAFLADWEKVKDVV